MSIVQLDRIRMQARLRNPWQAIDLGCVLARSAWWPLFLSWAIPYAIIFGIGLLATPVDWWWLVGTLAWWLKPLWDTVPLYILSRRLFDEEVSLLTAWRSALQTLGAETIAWLTWRRLSPTRAFDMPITILERLRGKQRAARLRVLHPRSSNAAIWLLMTCAHLEVAIGIGLLSLIFWMLPESLTFSMQDFFRAKSADMQSLYFAAFGIGSALVAPFYTAAGFALYLNRRIELEGWDIEIRFRHIAAQAQRQRALPTLLLALCLFAPAFGETSYADEPAPEPATTAAASPEEIAKREQTRAQIDAVLAGPDFRSEQTQRTLRFKKPEDKKHDSAVPDWMIDFVEWMENRGAFSRSHRSGIVGFADVVRFLLAALLIGLFVYLLYRYRDSLGEWLRLPQRRARSQVAPEVLFGLDLRTQSLPDDVIHNVQALVQTASYREALSLLYRASLSRLLNQFALPFRDDMTEGECAQLVAAHTTADITTFFAQLTRAWQRQAYAHLAPTPQMMAELCAHWQQVFADAG